MRLLWTLVIGIGWLACAAAGMSGDGEGDAPVAVPQLRYDRDIRPLLSDRCFRCHGPDAKKRRGKLRLDEAEGAFADRGGYAAIVPGMPDESELVSRIAHDDAKKLMPPPASNKRPLTASEQELVRRWIEQGARYEPHWSFIAPQRPAPPQPSSNAAVDGVPWPRNAIDRFVLAKLQSEHVAPSPEADPETQLRRVFLDLTGLPPTPEEIDAFLADRRDDPDGAYERVVDRLFTEEPYRSRYAERMATPWLDAARYADTCGIHTDAGRQMWLWRDWVLEAFRENLPFDRFLTEQLAGDLLPDATDEQRIASGFNRNHVTTDEGGAIAEEYLVEYAVDRASTTGSVFLAMTVGCARCHEHKFDPISQEEFFGFYSFFNSIEEPGLYSQLPDSNRAFEPFLVVPTAEQKQQLETLKGERDHTRAELDQGTPEESAQYEAFLGGLPATSGVAWPEFRLLGAKSSEGATLTPQPDGSVLASGTNPARDEHELILRTNAAGLRLLQLEALVDASLPEGRVGRAFNGNAVLTGVEAEATSLADPAKRHTIRFAWAWADHEQADGDHRAVNVLDTSDGLGWAVDGHRKTDGRVLLLLAQEPFGFEGGSDVRVKLQYLSQYAQHVLGRVRLALGQLEPRGLDLLRVAASGWHLTGPFPAADGQAAFDTAFGPEGDASLDLARTFPVAGSANASWRIDPELLDGKLNNLAEGVNAFYVARRIFAPTARKLELSVGSDDGFRLFLDGKEVASKRVDRGLAADQDKVAIELLAGVHVQVTKIANTGGPAGFFQRSLPRDGELTGDLVAALLPARTAPLDERLRHGWKITYSPGYREKRDRIAALEQQLATLEATTPRTMVMQELPAPRMTFVLTRGAYDKADPERPVQRGVPASLGRLPEGAPNDRLGLAQWMTSAENPLVARVAANRLWELLFGVGIVATSEDFGLQGEWPSHPELLDWLAVEFRESGWNSQNLLRLMVTSSTYRQSSRRRPDVSERDPDNRWLASFPRQRLTAEQIRDQALYVSGLLIERFGGASVKPYQPDGLWNEVAMPASNTRTFVRGDGDELWRRSLYTYWKRACPPPSLQTFDAPTRESCTIRRMSTNTPLQALALWNDEQYVEAARVLAQRTLAEPCGKTRGDLSADTFRLAMLHRRCTGRMPDLGEIELLATKLGEFRARYVAAPADAEALLKVGAAPRNDELPPAELAAWTLIANALLSLDATICRS